MNQFAHPALKAQSDRTLVYTAMSKHLFYFRMFISAFVLQKNGVPLNPFMVFDYFLLDVVGRDTIREANNNLVKKCDEVWVFGAVSDGVLAEIKIAHEQGKVVKYFTVRNSREIIPIPVEDVELEAKVSGFRNLL